MELKLLEAQRQNPLSFLISEYSPYPVYRRIVDLLQPADIITVSRTCKALSTLYPNLLSTDWDLNRALKRYTDDPKRFRSALNGCKAVMAGSFVLDFFDTNVTNASQLEIYLGAYAADRLEPQDYVDWVEPDGGGPSGLARKNNCDRLFQHLTDVEGYVLIQDDDLADDDAMFHRSSGFVFWHTDTLVRSQSGARIRLISPSTKRWDGSIDNERREYYETWKISSEACATIGHLLSQLTSTAAANFIFDTSAVCMFPNLTFAHRTALPTNEPVFLDLDYGQSAPALTRRHILAKQDFFPTLSSETAHDRTSRTNLHGVEKWLEYPRPLAGPCSWTIPLAMHGVKPSSLPPYIVDTTRIDVAVSSDYVGHVISASDRPRCQRLHLQWFPRWNTALRFCYTNAWSDDFDVKREEMIIFPALQTFWEAYYEKVVRHSKVLYSKDRRSDSPWQYFHRPADFPLDFFQDDMMPDLVSQVAALRRADPRRPYFDQRIQIHGLNPRLS